ncbi:TraR/DksA C4-type zinc finger protein [Candidatus Falkowbacteria bacterium]|nr:TraR/DksA C4-type zinc finger protein [Candidatus Falkowbacteria bacterium]
MARSREKELLELQEELVKEKEKLQKSLEHAAQGRVEMQEYNENNDVMSKNDESAGELSEIIADKEILATLEKQMKDIDQALALMKKGGYGVCKYCGKDIPLARLKVRPVSTSCVDCKSQFTN